MSYNVDIFVDDVWVKTVYGIIADDSYHAQQIVEDDLAIDFAVESND